MALYFSYKFKNKIHKIDFFICLVYIYCVRCGDMDINERNKIYDEGLEAFGMQCQYDQCMEEMAELMVAINKVKRQTYYGEYKGDSSKMANLFEELADVYICVEGLAHFLGEKDFDAMVDKKMRKFKDTIDKCGKK